MKITGVLAVLALLASVRSTQADIFEWQDADGVRHFTNSKADVPSAESPQVVVAERNAPSIADAPVAPAVASEPPRQAQVVYDTNQAAEAYLQGLQQGLALAQRGVGNDVTINGPLAVAGARGGEVPWYPYYQPLVTTGFDHGRSRHRTLRMLLQEQFQIDRDGPFVVERLPPGLGPNLSPFLPRGLPQDFPAGQRVLFY
ncbi:MAG TPA: DUF4124 domain-containing protein [Candidatus Kryptonia bacterium]|nr:DUF4124 domain-containing protein [Candidatus Kryptonia bacterium]